MLDDALSPPVVTPVEYARERMEYHKSLAKFWNATAKETGDHYSRQMAENNERFSRAWRNELVALESVAACRP